MNGLPDDLSAFIAALSPARRASLLQALLANNRLDRRPDADSLQACEQILWGRIQGGRQFATGRLWFIYMLLRYGGMRLKEIQSLTELDCAFGAGRVTTNGRAVLFAPAIAARLAKFWAIWPGRNSRLPFACDASMIRRSLAQLGRDMGREGLNARYLRRHREMELANGGLHPGLVAWFMDGRGSPVGEKETEAAVRYYLERENAMKTSARNVFSGIVTEILENGILTSVTLRTEDGLSTTAIITSTSRENLKLVPGTAVRALVKAPWVTLNPVGARAEATPPNCYEGTVEEVNRDALACEIHVNLNQGGKICALYANGAWPSKDIGKGAQVIASFSPFSVVLTEN